jgi:hypothetical protein
MPLGSKVNWVNQIEETRAAYDFIYTPPSSDLNSVFVPHGMNNNVPGRRSTSALFPLSFQNSFIEVKTSKFPDRNVFEISYLEWMFACSEPRVPYHIFRVISAGNPEDVKVIILRDIATMVSEKKLKLCLAM